MLELKHALEIIINEIESTVFSFGFKVEYPEGVLPPALPVSVSGNKSIIMYRGEKGRIRIEYENEKIALFTATADESDTPDDDMTRASLSLLDLDEYEENDVKYICGEFAKQSQTPSRQNARFRRAKSFPHRFQRQKPKAAPCLMTQTPWAAVSLQASAPRFAMNTKETLKNTANFLPKISL